VTGAEGSDRESGGGQPEARRHLRLAGPAAAERAAELDELGAGRSMDGAVDTAAAEQGRVRRVDDRVDALGRDVSSNELQPRTHEREGIAPVAPVAPVVDVGPSRSWMAMPSTDATRR